MNAPSKKETGEREKQGKTQVKDWHNGLAPRTGPNLRTGTTDLHNGLLPRRCIKI